MGVVVAVVARVVVMAVVVEAVAGENCGGGGGGLYPERDGILHPEAAQPLRSDLRHVHLQ